jgi:hypothetical protein
MSCFHGCSYTVEDSNKHIIEEIVRQVVYLPELYKNARSEKYIKKADIACKLISARFSSSGSDALPT